MTKNSCSKISLKWHQICRQRFLPDATCCLLQVTTPLFCCCLAASSVLVHISCHDHTKYCKFLILQPLHGRYSRITIETYSVISEHQISGACDRSMCLHTIWHCLTKHMWKFVTNIRKNYKYEVST